MIWSTASSSWGGLGWLWVPIMAVMMIGCMLMMGGMMRHSGYGSHHGHHHGQPPESAEQVLSGPLARGEIDVEQYNRLLAVVQHHSESARANGSTVHDDDRSIQAPSLE
jgi:uncharacterized membrane protein